jgi:hypothetical protein
MPYRKPYTDDQLATIFQIWRVSQTPALMKELQKYARQYALDQKMKNAAPRLSEARAASSQLYALFHDLQPRLHKFWPHIYKLETAFGDSPPSQLVEFTQWLPQADRHALYEMLRQIEDLAHRLQIGVFRLEELLKTVTPVVAETLSTLPPDKGPVYARSPPSGVFPRRSTKLSSALCSSNL